MNDILPKKTVKPVVKPEVKAPIVAAKVEKAPTTPAKPEVTELLEEVTAPDKPEVIEEVKGGPDETKYSTPEGEVKKEIEVDETDVTEGPEGGPEEDLNDPDDDEDLNDTDPDDDEDLNDTDPDDDEDNEPEVKPVTGIAALLASRGAIKSVNQQTPTGTLRSRRTGLTPQQELAKRKSIRR